MATKTANYGLIKPDGNEYYDISVQNENADMIDGELAGLQKSKSGKSVLVSVTIPASGWTGNDVPYRQTVLIADVTATSANEILPGASITVAPVSYTHLTLPTIYSV